MKYDFITIGGAVIDETFTTDEGKLMDNSGDLLRQRLVGFEYGAKIVLSDYHQYFGGGAANAAVSFSRLGFKSAAFVQIGNDDRGRDILDNFKREKVSTKFVKISQKLSTGFSFIVVTKGGEHVAFTNRGANDQLSINFAEKKAMDQAKWLYVSSLSGEWESVLDKVFSVVGARFAWNPGNAQLKAGLRKLSKYLKVVDVLVLNKDEATELVMSDPQFKAKSKKALQDVENLLKMLKPFGPEMIVITSGAKGAHVYDGKKIYYEKPIKVASVADTTGVGDAFSSGFVAGLDHYENDIKKAMHLGIRNSAYVIGRPGAQNGLMKV